MKLTHHKKEIIPLDVTDLAFGGRGVARENDYVWFVDGGIPGQRVLARIYHVRKQYGEARAVEVVTRSPHQIDPVCPYFGVCGGCQLQHLRYDVQVQAKTRQVTDILQRIGGFQGVEVRPTLPASEIYGYRNKMEFTFSDQRWISEGEASDHPAGFALGLHVPGRFDKVLDIDACPLQSDNANRIFKTVRSLVLETGLPPYGLRSHQGIWRFLVIREGKNTGDLMVHFITSGQESGRVRETVDHITKKLLVRHRDITAVSHSTTDRLAQAAYGETERILHGSGKIREKLRNRIFEISSGAFFQTNTGQAEQLFNTVIELAGFTGQELVYDLYCGTGAIGICIADRVREVVGIEAVEPAVRDALRNTELNGLTNVSFVAGDMKDALRSESFRSEFGQPDIVVLDPPRGGTHPDTVRELLELGAQKIVYVSCNPAILARDLKILCERIYSIQAVQPVDMFPHTGHIETVAVLDKKKVRQPDP
jgi:23S rRNA (uracil1939-C5)-methyltransferase